MFVICVFIDGFFKCINYGIIMVLKFCFYKDNYLFLLFKWNRESGIEICEELVE